MGDVLHSVVVEPQLLLAGRWVGLAHRLSGSEDCAGLQPVSCSAGAGPTGQGPPQCRGGPAETPLWMCCLWS